MTRTDKDQILRLFEQKRKELGLSRERAAIQAGTKGSTLSQVINGKYGADDTAIYRLLARWIGYDERHWVLADTVNHRLIFRTLTEAQHSSQAYAITGAAGCGKSSAFQAYARKHRNVVHFTCDEFYSKQLFLREILRQLGKDHGWMSLSEMMHVITSQLIAADRPLIIIDEADKLRNDVLYLFISLYNRLEDNCGLVMAATDYLTKRLERGLKFNWKGYQEIWSRIGRKPVECLKTRPTDVRMICQANGVDDDREIERIVLESEGDLRRVKRMVHRAKLMEVA